LKQYSAFIRAALLSLEFDLKFNARITQRFDSRQVSGTGFRIRVALRHCNGAEIAAHQKNAGQNETNYSIHEIVIPIQDGNGRSPGGISLPGPMCRSMTFGSWLYSRYVVQFSQLQTGDSFSNITRQSNRSC
jgi:hypothetical protein